MCILKYFILVNSGSALLADSRHWSVKRCYSELFWGSVVFSVDKTWLRFVFFMVSILNKLTAEFSAKISTILQPLEWSAASKVQLFLCPPTNYKHFTPCTSVICWWLIMIRLSLKIIPESIASRPKVMLNQGRLSGRQRESHSDELFVKCRESASLLVFRWCLNWSLVLRGKNVHIYFYVYMCIIRIFSRRDCDFAEYYL